MLFFGLQEEADYPQSSFFLAVDKSWMDGQTNGQIDRTIAPTSEIVVENARQGKRAVSETVREWLAAKYH